MERSIEVEVGLVLAGNEEILLVDNDFEYSIPTKEVSLGESMVVVAKQCLDEFGLSTTMNNVKFFSTGEYVDGINHKVIVLFAVSLNDVDTSKASDDLVAIDPKDLALDLPSLSEPVKVMIRALGGQSFIPFSNGSIRNAIQIMG